MLYSKFEPAVEAGGGRRPGIDPKAVGKAGPQEEIAGQRRRCPKP
jgi:hypothetical protein